MFPANVRRADLNAFLQADARRWADVVGEANIHTE